MHANTTMSGVHKLPISHRENEPSPTVVKTIPTHFYTNGSRYICFHSFWYDQLLKTDEEKQNKKTRARISF